MIASLSSKPFPPATVIVITRMDMDTQAVGKLFVALLCLCIVTSSGINCPGCTPLDELSFDKIIRKFSASLVKFDVAYPYGEQHEEFAKIAREAFDSEDLFVGEVGIKDYSDRDNERLAARFEVKKDDYPVAILFVRNEKGEIEQFRYDGKFLVDDLKKFVRKNSGIYLPLPGCIEGFDKLVDKLLVTSKEERKNVLKEAEDLWDKTHGPRMSKRADIYVKIMRKIVDDNEGFVNKEIERVKKLLTGKVSSDKKEELEEKLNILKTFTGVSRAKDEL